MPLNILARTFTAVFLICAAIICLAASAHSAPAPEEFGTLPAVYDAAISPDSSQIAVFVNYKGIYGVRIISLKTEDKKPRIIMLREGIKPQWVKWANNEQVLISLWENDKIGSTPVTVGFIYTLNTNTMKGKYLITPKGITRQYNNQVIDFLNDDPEHILMSFSDTDVFAPDIQKVNVVSGRYGRERRGNSQIQNWYTDLRGEPRIGQGLRDNTDEEKWRLMVRDVDDNKWRSSDEYPGLDADSSIYGFTGNPNELIIGLTKGRDTRGFYIYDLEAKAQTRKLFHHDDYDVSGLILSADGKDIMGASFVGDSKEIQLFDKYDTVLDRMRKRFTGFNIDYIDQSKNGRIVLFSISNGHSPGALMMVNGDTDQLTHLAQYRPGLPEDQMGEVISVKYTARDGFKIPAYVTLPPSVTGTDQIKDLPFIILPHGGPYARTSRRFDYFAQFFASRGYGVLQMNFRGSAGYGEAFKDAGRKNWVLMKEDVEDGTRWLIEKGYADPKRVCIAGWSYGGYAALMGAIRNPELYACSISMAGVTDLKDMISDMEKYRFGKLSAKDFVLQGFEDKDDIRENSPVRRAEDYSVPLFLAHGEDDQRVHFDQFKRMKRALRKSSAPVTYMEFKDEDHFLSNQKNRQKFFTGLDKFLLETMGESEHKTPD